MRACLGAQLEQKVAGLVRDSLSRQGVDGPLPLQQSSPMCHSLGRELGQHQLGDAAQDLKVGRQHLARQLAQDPVGLLLARLPILYVTCWCWFQE